MSMKIEGRLEVRSITPSNKFKNNYLGRILSNVTWTRKEE
jgi:hypothetical protein